MKWDKSDRNVDRHSSGVMSQPFRKTAHKTSRQIFQATEAWKPHVIIMRQLKEAALADDVQSSSK